MKFKTTTKAIKESGEIVINAGYCELQNLLNFVEPDAYTCGVYGWNYDVYKVYGVIICTGYRGMPGKRAKDIKAFDTKAEHILYNREYMYSDRKPLIEELLKEFCRVNREEVK